MVGVLRSYCNHNLATRQLNELIESVRDSTPTDRSGRRIPSKANPKLALDQVKDLIAFYQQGDSLLQLSRRFGIHRGTAKEHLRRAGIEIRPGNVARLSDEDKNEIARLYEAGLSIHRLALRFGVTDNPVHNALRERGVRMRSPNEKSPTPADE
jgi:lambda repressor-like predicted transcriptional regulator